MKFVAVKMSGKVDVHADSTDSTYATLCGLDGDDSHPHVEQSPAVLPKQPKITCVQCQMIIEHAKKYRVTWRKERTR